LEDIEPVCIGGGMPPLICIVSTPSLLIMFSFTLEVSDKDIWSLCDTLLGKRVFLSLSTSESLELASTFFLWYILLYLIWSCLISHRTQQSSVKREPNNITSFEIGNICFGAEYILGEPILSILFNTAVDFEN
jgi:hypothetical protein